VGNRRTQQLTGDPADVAFFDARMDSHLPRAFARVMRRLPSDPRCRLCNAPFGGPGGRIMRRAGFGPSRKNPTLCNTCFEKAPMGGVEMEIGVLFADVRGFTALAGPMAPDDVADLLNRFYGVASKILTRSAIVDKLVGDEVMALYLPQLLDDDWEDELVRDATDLLRGVGFGAAERPWLPLAVGVDVGRAYVGNVGAGEVKDFTALGDVVNTAARLQDAARAGEIVVSEVVYERIRRRYPQAAPTPFDLRGKAEPVLARVLAIGD
jgi:adenylate cyclase